MEPGPVVHTANSRALPSKCTARCLEALEGAFHDCSMRDCSRIGKNFFYFFLRAHRATAALRALALRSAADSLAARAFPPLSPPSRPKATAAAFFFLLFTPQLSQTEPAK